MSLAMVRTNRTKKHVVRRDGVYSDVGPGVANRLLPGAWERLSIAQLHPRRQTSIRRSGTAYLENTDFWTRGGEVVQYDTRDFAKLTHSCTSLPGGADLVL